MLTPVGNVTRSQRPGTPACAAAGVSARAARERASAMRGGIATTLSETSALEQRLCLLGDVVDVEAEAFEDLGAGRRRAEALQRDRRVDPLLPAHADPGLDRQLRHAGGQHGLAVVGVL